MALMMLNPSVFCDLPRLLVVPHRDNVVLQNLSWLTARKFSPLATIAMLLTVTSDSLSWPKQRLTMGIHAGGGAYRQAWEYPKFCMAFR